MTDQKSEQKSDKLLETFGTCIKDLEGNIVYQNEASKKYCGNHQGGSCKDKGCHEYYKAGAADLPKTRLLPQRFCNGQYFDIVFLKTDQHLTTIINPLGTDAMADEKVLMEHGLTTRECEIAKLVQRGYTNREIMEKLSISKSTLKTHINHIYRKLGDKRRQILGRKL